MTTANLTPFRAAASAAVLLIFLIHLDPASASGSLAEGIAGAAAPSHSAGARQLDVRHRLQAGAPDTAYLPLPHWYGRDRTQERPLVLSAPGRGLGGRSNAQTTRRDE